MTFTGMSAGNPDTVRSLPESGKQKLDTDSPGAGNPDDTNVWRIFHSAYPGQISRSITAPVAKKTYDYRFPIRHSFPLQIGISEILPR